MDLNTAIFYAGTIIYPALLFVALNFYFYITYKVKIYRTENVAIRNFRRVYLGLVIALITYTIPELVYLKPETNYYNIAITYFGIALAYTISIFGIGRFLLKAINFHTITEKITKILLSIETSVMAILTVLLFSAIFSPQMKSFADVIIAILGAIVLISLFITVIVVFFEAFSSVNKMSKLRLYLTGIGISGIFLDGLANVLHVVVDFFHNPLYIELIVPTMAILFFLMPLIGLYFALFPPIWLQRVTNVLPPSFHEMMKKRNALREKQRGK